jgi:hypothetical protein
MVRDSTPVSITSTAVSREAAELPFHTDETLKTFSKFDTTGRSLLTKLKPPTADQEPTAYLRECITSLTDYLVEIPDRDLVGLKIRNTENVEDKVMGLSIRRRDQLKPDVIWDVPGKVV